VIFVMAGQGGNNCVVSPQPTRKRYRWHHIVVSTLCVCALVAVVSSLFTTFENIHNMKRKKKRDLSVPSVVTIPSNATSTSSAAISEGSGSGSGSASSTINVMEINRSIVPKPLQQKNITLSSWSIATGGTVRNASAAISAS